MDVIMTVFGDVRHDRSAWTRPPLHLESIDEFIQVIMFGFEVRSLFEKIDERCSLIAVQVMIDEEAVSLEIAAHVSSSSVIRDSGRRFMHCELVSLQFFGVVLAIPTVPSFARFQRWQVADRIVNGQNRIQSL